MKEPYGKGAATLFRPRVLGGASRGVRRSVDRGIGGPGDRAPITDEPGADTVCLVGRQHPFEATKSRAWAGRGVVEDPGTSRNNMHENRETSRASIETVDRSAKAPSRNAGMHAMEESDCCVVPMKQPNNEGQPSAEAAEGRRQPKENDVQSNTPPTQRGARVSQGLSGVRRAARERKQERFTALLHHVTLNLLRESFDALKKNAAPGVDGVTWREYETGLEGRVADLHDRVHRGTYRAQPSRRVYIPKAWKATTVGHRGAGGQDCSTGRGDRPQ